MRIYGDLSSGNCLKVKYTADFLGLDYDWMDLLISCKVREPCPGFFTDESTGTGAGNSDWKTGVAWPSRTQLSATSAQGNRVITPEDNYLQAKVDEWLFWEQYSHEPYIAVCRFHMLYQGKPLEARESWRVERGENALDYMENHLSGRQWLAGDTFTIADIALLAYTRVAHEGWLSIWKSVKILQQWVQDCETTFIAITACPSLEMLTSTKIGAGV